MSTVCSCLLVHEVAFVTRSGRSATPTSNIPQRISKIRLELGAQDQPERSGFKHFSHWPVHRPSSFCILLSILSSRKKLHDVPLSIRCSRVYNKLERITMNHVCEIELRIRSATYIKAYHADTEHKLSAGNSPASL